MFSSTIFSSHFSVKMFLKYSRTRLDVLVTHCLLLRTFLCSFPLLLIGLTTLVTETVHEDFIAVDAFASLDPAFPVAILASLFAAAFSLHKLE